jgi:UDP-galactopyranose mutase
VSKKYFLLIYNKIMTYSKYSNNNFLLHRSEILTSPFNVSKEVQIIPEPEPEGTKMDEFSDDEDVSLLLKDKLEIREKNKKKKSLPGDKILKKIRKDMFKKQHQLKIQRNITGAVSSVIKSKL